MLPRAAVLLLLLQRMGVSAAPAADLAPNDPGYYCNDTERSSRSEACRFFVVVIDAGSTGTRLHLFRFVRRPHSEGGLPFEVEQEVFNETKPGLSDFVGRPATAATTVQRHIDHATSIVPAHLWAATPIALKATAGLRLLPSDAVAQILGKVNATVRASGFACSASCVGLLDGDEEGVDAWKTLNLLLGNFHRGKNTPGRSAAAFDLGGGSTQVTFRPANASLLDAEPDRRDDIDFLGTHMKLYAHSYLGAGLHAARLGVLQQRRLKGSDASGELMSPCFPADFRLARWPAAQREWSVRGSPSHSFEHCGQRVSAFIRRSNITRITHLLFPAAPAYVFSYFYDGAVESGLMEEGEQIRQLQVRDYRRVAERACASFSSARPWQCLDLTYLHALLTHGYGFTEDRDVIAVRRINAKGISWALGLAYSLVDQAERKGKSTKERKQEKMQQRQLQLQPQPQLLRLRHGVLARKKASTKAIASR